MRALILLFSLSLAAAPAVIVFKPLDKGIGSMALSEDGRYAFAAHSSEDRVSIWELRTSQKVVDLTTAAPHFLLSRGQKLFVLGFKTAAVQVYQGPAWTLSKTIPIDVQAPTLLSAPRGPYFRGEILVSAGEYNSRRLVLIDLEADTVKRVAGSGASAEVDFSGKDLFIQGEFGHSPRSGSLFAYSDRRRSLEPRSRNGSSRHRIWHPRPTPFWVDDRNVYNDRIQRLGEFGTLLPDQSRDLVYSLGDGKFRAHRLADGLELIGTRELAKTPAAEPQRGGGRLAYQFRPSLAQTNDAKLHLFTYDQGSNTYVHAVTASFDKGAVPAPRPMPIVEAIGEGERAHRRALAAARSDLLSAFDLELKRIAKTGNLDGIDALQVRQAAFEKDGKLPMSTTLYGASASHEAARKAAHIALVQVYSESIIALTQALRIDEARELRDKRDALVAESAAIIEHSTLEGGFRKLRIGEDVPALLRPSADAFIKENGLVAGSLRSPQGDYLTRSFVVDLLSDGDARIRLGDEFSVEFEDRHVRARVADRSVELGRFPSAGPHLLRLEKRGGSLIAAWTAEFADVFVPSGSHLVVSIAESLPKLTNKNSFLSLSGRIRALRVSESGELRTSPTKAKPWPQLQGGWHALSNRGGQPDFMRGHARNLADANALQGNLRSHTGDFLTHDFIIDVKVFGDSDLRLGDAADSATLRIRSGMAELALPHQRARSLGRFYTDGPHILRLAKSAGSLSIGLADGEQDAIQPVASLPRLSEAVPGLNVHNGFLVVNGRIAGLRMAVDGKPIPPPKRPRFEHPVRMSPQAILNPGAKGAVRFAATDLAKRDFVFDLQYRFKPDSTRVLEVGIGHGNKRLSARLHGEGHHDAAYLALGRPEPLIGKVPGPGPHWIRLSKVGATLTFAIAVNHGEDFEPFFSRTIPDLLAAAPWTEAGNAEIIYQGGDELLAAQLSIEGKPSPRAHTGNTLRVANSAIAIPETAKAGKRLKTSIVTKGKAKITLVAAPEGLKISSRGALSWEPTKDQTGRFPVQLRVAVDEVVTELSAEMQVQE
jgi:hypothetical protein